MLRRWISGHDPDRVFLHSEAGTLTYRDLQRVQAEGGEVVVEPESLDAVRRLMAAGESGTRVVLIDPHLDSAEKSRRVGLAAQARDRQACTIVFTSGTTGAARGVRLTPRNWEAAARASAQFLAMSGDDVWLAAMPLHHVGGLSILYRSAFVGSSVRWLPRFDTASAAAALREGVTLVSLVPTMLRRILDHDSHHYRGLKAALIGGGPIPPGLLEEAHSRGIPALPTYGLTETCAQVATLRLGSGPRYAAHALPGVDLRISPQSRIMVRSDQVSPGYVDEDDRPPGEWFTTPDLGRLEEDGALRVLGRADQVIVTGGENVDPARVEGALLSSPGVTAATVVALPDPEWGQVVAAAYEGSAHPDDLRRWLKGRLAPHEIPRRILRCDPLPMTGGGKPDRAAITARLTSG